MMAVDWEFFWESLRSITSSCQLYLVFTDHVIWDGIIHDRNQVCFAFHTCLYWNFNLKLFERKKNSSTVRTRDKKKKFALSRSFVYRKHVNNNLFFFSLSLFFFLNEHWNQVCNVMTQRCECDPLFPIVSDNGVCVPRKIFWPLSFKSDSTTSLTSAWGRKRIKRGRIRSRVNYSRPPPLFFTSVRSPFRPITFGQCQVGRRRARPDFRVSRMQKRERRRERIDLCEHRKRRAGRRRRQLFLSTSRKGTKEE